MNTGSSPELITVCPHCGYKQDGHAGATPDATPSPGDASICWRCGKFSVYGDDMWLRVPTDEEFDTIRKSDEGVRARKAWIMTQELPDPSPYTAIHAFRKSGES